MDLKAARIALVQEARELLSEMETALLGMERDGYDAESLHAVFRAAHTIKGSMGLFGLDHIVRFTHELESVLDAIRSGTLQADTAMIALFIQCGDHLLELIGGVETDSPQSPEQSREGLRLEERLRRLHPSPKDRPQAPAPRRSIPAERTAEAETLANQTSVSSDTWHLSVQFSPDLLELGMDPLSVLRYLSTFGKLLKVVVVDGDLPPASALDPTRLHLGFEIQFSTAADRQRIEDAFSFVREGSRIRILPPHAKIEEYIRLIGEHRDHNDKIGQILVGCGAVTELELAEALAHQEGSIPPPQPVGKLLVDRGAVPPAVVAAALEKQKAFRERTNQESRLVKVDAKKLDALIDLVGELVVANAAAKIAARSEKAKKSEEAVETLTTLVENIRDAALGMRMVPIGEVFHRFPRLVRDLAIELGKKVELEIQGADTELDKSMVERLADPLTHMVRNAMDHAIEPESVRLAAGKPPHGTLRFNAYHETGSIVIEVSDDGDGINRARVLDRAIERGIVQKDQELSDTEIVNLIFQPGFSTAETVTNLSGRGVGMDAVKQSIEALRGEIEIDSEEGCGTVFRLRMPLTLAIIDGFLVGVDDRFFVVPLDLVIECADLPKRSALADHGRGMTNLRGEALPLVHLRDLFGIAGTAPQRENIMVVEYGGRRMGLVVEHLLGELQTVIKPLSRLFSKVPGVGGSTILGSGEIALILDVPALVQRIERAEAKRWSEHSVSDHSSREPKGPIHAK